MLEVSEIDLIRRLNFDNPWWESGKSIESPYAEFNRRAYFRSFYNLASNVSVSRAVILMGPRRVGKTVILYHTIQELLASGVDGNKIMYLSLETPIYTGLHLESFLNRFIDKFNHKRNDRLFVFFDEIQYLKDWELHLKSLVDSYKAIKFIASGSAAAALRLKSRESGAGRFTEFMLPPLTFAEYLDFRNRESELLEEIKPEHYKATDIEELNQEFINYMNFGGYPEAVFSEQIQKDSSRYIKSDIIDKVLLRDLPGLYGISDIQELNRLFTTLAYNTGNEVSLEKLSHTSGVAKNTLKRYLDYLEAAFLIKRVNRIDQNARRFQRATHFKVYLTNPTMRSALFGFLDTDDKAMGLLAETAVFSQWFHDTNFLDRIFYARWKNGEIDIVYNAQEPSIDWAVEVKWSDRPYSDTSAWKNLVEFGSRNFQPAKKEDPPNLTITTKSIHGERLIDKYRLSFEECSVYAYRVGKNLVAYRDFREDIDNDWEDIRKEITISPPAPSEL